MGTFETDACPEVFGELELCGVGLKVVDMDVTVTLRKLLLPSFSLDRSLVEGRDGARTTRL